MKFTWKGKWKEGEIIVEAETLEELNSALKELESLGRFQKTPSQSNYFPEIPSMLGCTDAVRMLMKAPWGKQPRSMSEIKKVLEVNALHFTKEALAATLVTMVKRGDLRRVKEDGKWKYLAK
jgi:hypothetical protein